MISTGRGPCLALRSKEPFLPTILTLTTLTAHYDAYISRFTVFLWTMTTISMTDGQTDYFIVNFQLNHDLSEVWITNSAVSFQH